MNLREHVNNISLIRVLLIFEESKEDPPDKEMATHSTILGWEIPRTEEPDGL